MNHRNGSIGNYKYEKTGEKSAIITCTNPYPDDFDKGIISAMARRFKPATSSIVNVKVDETKPARSKGGEETTYTIKW
ncbi:hypothetical protein ACFLTE_06090 [Bacteroidota bacterium]